MCVCVCVARVSSRSPNPMRPSQCGPAPAPPFHVSALFNAGPQHCCRPLLSLSVSPDTPWVPQVQCHPKISARPPNPLLDPYLVLFHISRTCSGRALLTSLLCVSTAVPSLVSLPLFLSFQPIPTLQNPLVESCLKASPPPPAAQQELANLPRPGWGGEQRVLAGGLGKDGPEPGETSLMQGG